MLTTRVPFFSAKNKKTESSLPNQAKLKKKNLCGGKGGFYPRMIFPCPDQKHQFLGVSIP
jgi:hypothetical protein